MADRYVLNLQQQSNGDNEVHKDGCTYFPDVHYEELGDFYSCSAAVVAAKLTYPFKKINGCKYCAEPCHTQ